jgi:hypothetical protein
MDKMFDQILDMVVGAFAGAMFITAVYGIFHIQF